MGNRHQPLLVFDDVVGDVVEGDHNISFYSVRPALRSYDGCSFATVSELKTLIEKALAPMVAA